MEISFIIIFLTFVQTILDNFVLNNYNINDNDNKYKNIVYKIVKSKYTLFLLLAALLVFQIIAEYKSNKSSDDRYDRASKAYDTLYVTHHNVKKVNSSVSNLLWNIDSTLKITKKELGIISNVNKDLEKIRLGINNSLKEFSSIKEQYEKQIKIEKEKIIEAKPIIEVGLVKSIIDSVSFAYQFQLYNSGVRLADSIIYHSLAVLVDVNFLFKDIALYRTNADETNVLNISNNSIIGSRIFNSQRINIDELNNLSAVYILIAYKYKDNMTNKIEKKIMLYRSMSFEKGEKQFGTNIKEAEEDEIKKYLYRNDRNLYNTFYN